MQITESFERENIGISLWKQDWLDKITKESGELAKDNEYQVHMWSLVIRKSKEDGSIIDIAIPLVIYNYKQEVYTASIDFEGKDVKEMSEMTLELANHKAQELASKLPKALKDNAELLIVPFSNLHRHP